MSKRFIENADTSSNPQLNVISFSRADLAISSLHTLYSFATVKIYDQTEFCVGDKC